MAADRTAADDGAGTRGMAAAVACHKRGEIEEAERLCRQVLAADPDHADAHQVLGVLAAERSDFDAAARHFRRAVAADGTRAELHVLLGRAERSSRRLADAADSYRRAHALRPGDTAIAYGLGQVLADLGDIDGARAALEEVVARDPGHDGAWLRLGTVRMSSGDFSGARAALERSFAADPTRASALVNLGALAMAEANPREAVTCCRQAISIQPELAEAHRNYGLSLLSIGDFAAGWKEYEWRWQAANFPGIQRDFTAPLWDGTALGGRTILLHAEQGVGDTIQFCRYVPVVAAVHPQVRILFELDPRLAELAQRSFGDRVQVHPYTDPAGGNLPLFDVHAPLMSLPHLLGTTLTTVPADVPYLVPVRPPLPARPEGRLTVGLSWFSANVTSGKDRSIPLSELAPIGNVAGLHFINLQYGDTAAERHAATAAGLAVDAAPGFDFLSDLSAFADQVAACDLVVSIDNTTVHMAGALGRPVWTLLPYASDWRWMEVREDSPWYPTMRLFRQRRPGDWAEVIVRVTAALATFTKR